MKLVCSEREAVVGRAAWPHKFNWAEVAGRTGFTVHNDQDVCLADVNFNDHTAREYCIGFFGKDVPVRIVPVKEVLPSVRLFLSVAKRRKTLNSGVVMMVWPK